VAGQGDGSVADGDSASLGSGRSLPSSPPWRLQVPNFVAKRWKACCDHSVQRGEPTGRKLATLRLVQAPDEAGAAKTQYQLQLDGARA
jgi:hypothetical protein